MREKTVSYDHLLDYSRRTGKSMGYLLDEAEARGFYITDYIDEYGRECSPDSWLDKPKSVTKPKAVYRPKPVEDESDNRLLLMC